MSEHDNVRTIGEIYTAFWRGGLPTVLSKLAENVDWRHARSADIPRNGNCRGREAVAQFFAAMR